MEATVGGASAWNGRPGRFRPRQTDTPGLVQATQLVEMLLGKFGQKQSKRVQRRIDGDAEEVSKLGECRRGTGRRAPIE